MSLCYKDGEAEKAFALFPLLEKDTDLVSAQPCKRLRIMEKEEKAKLLRISYSASKRGVIMHPIHRMTHITYYLIYDGRGLYDII